MAITNVKLIKQYKEADGTLSYLFERPEGFDFLPGQHVVIRVETNTGKSQDDIRTFTIASAPSEEGLLIGLREGISPFKKKMAALQPGDEVTFIGPAGRFTYPETNKDIVMIAGGIGVVPFRVFLKHAIDTNQKNNFTLFYSNPSVSRISYKEEFEEWNKEHSNIAIINTITQETTEVWNEETGRVDAAMIKKYVPNISDVAFYVCGPEKMVPEIEQMLEEQLGVDPKNIHSEKFTGY